MQETHVILEVYFKAGYDTCTLYMVMFNFQVEK